MFSSHSRIYFPLLSLNTFVVTCLFSCCYCDVSFRFVSFSLVCVFVVQCAYVHARLINIANRQPNKQRTQLPGYTGGTSGVPAKALYGPIVTDTIGFNQGTRPHQSNPLFAWDTASSALVWCLGTSTSSGTHNKCYRFRIGVDSAPQAWGRLGIGMYAKVNSGTRCVAEPVCDVL